MFILSKILLFLLFPITWVFLILISALITKSVKRRKQLMIAGLIALYLFSCPALLRTYARLWSVSVASTDQRPVYSCGILLGGFSGIRQDGSGFFNIVSDRFIEAVKLQFGHKVNHLLVSGGNGSLVPGNFREAVWTKSQLKQFNLPDSAIAIEPNSKNTIQNAVFTKHLLDSLHFAPPYLLVTSDFHMRRALYIFKKAGIDAVPYPTDFLAGQDRIMFDSFMPDGSTLYYWQFYTKELVGLVTAHLSKF